MLASRFRSREYRRKNSSKLNGPFSEKPRDAGESIQAGNEAQPETILF
jgi:hypothetical protein